MDRVSKLNSKRYCADPFKIHKKKISKCLRDLTQDLISINRDLNLTLDNSVCVNCFYRLTKTTSLQPKALEPSTSPEESDLESNSELTDISRSYEMSNLNTSLPIFEQSPFKKCRVSESKHYSKLKFKKAKVALKRKIEIATGQSVSSSENEDTETEILQQLKEKYNKAESRSEKLVILTVLPKSWSREKIINEFKCSQYTARQAKTLVKEKGVLSTPNPKLSKCLPTETIAKVIEFYLSSDISREMAGMKDYVSVKLADGRRERKQKHLILCNLKEAFQNFKEQNPEIKVGFSKFAYLRPKECVLAGASGTHCVCVCTIHQNVKLMFESIVHVFQNNLPDYLPEECCCSSASENYEDMPDLKYINHYSHCLALLHCNPPQEACFFGQCNDCTKKDKFISILQAAFDREGIDEIEIRQWISTDRSTLEMQKLSGDDFIHIFHEKLQRLLEHDFLAKTQAKSLQQMKEELSVSEFIVIGDFAENYAFIVQDAAQSFHWNNNQATLHPFVVYYRKDNELMHKSFVAISECNHHNAIAVHLFQTRLIEFLMSSHQITKISYFSDGCAAQYKNRKNFINLCHHKNDFGIDAEWHFFATSHSKGPCDGIGGTVKRLAAKASLQRTGMGKLILNASDLYHFAVDALPGIAFTFITTGNYETHRLKMEKRFETSKTIPGTQKIHFIRPVNEETLQVKTYSSSTVSRLESSVTNPQRKIQISAMKGYCLATYNSNWYLACILRVYPENNEVYLSFLHPYGPSSSFVYPSPPDEILVDTSDVMMIVSPVTQTGRTYKLTKQEMKKAEEMMHQ